MPDSYNPSSDWYMVRSRIGAWLSVPLIGASVASLLLAVITLPYWWLAAQWSEEILPDLPVRFTFVTTSFLLVLIVIDSVFIIRYYQIKRRGELAEKAEALRENEERFATIFREVPDPLLILDRAGVVQDINQAGRSLLQIPRDGLIGSPLPVSELFPDLDPTILDPSPHTGIVQDPVQTLMHLPDQSRRYVIVSTSLISLRRSPATLLLIHDIDEIRRTQNSLSQAHDQISLMNSITRHDILNRVTVVLSYSEFLLESLQDETMILQASRIHQSGTDIRHLIEFTREYQDLGVKKPEWQRLWALFYRPAVRNLLEGIRITLPERIVEISADPMLERVVYNLVENTRRHGGAVTRITVSFHQEGDLLCIVYTDDGVGILAEEKDLIFRKGHGKNTGLGLFLIREILAITGITIIETGTPGAGARFEMRVPPGSFRYADDERS